MSLSIMAQAFKARVGNPLRKLILIKLADHANDSGECWPSYQHIADQCEISKRSVIAHVKALEEGGFLRTIRRKVETGKNQSNIYLITLGGESRAPYGESHAPSGGESPAPRISHSLESINESPRKSNGPITLKTHIDNCKANGNSAIPDDHRVFRYADEVGIPHEYLWLAWKKFVDYYRDGQGARKKYIDWPATFCNYVKNNYGKLWWISDAGEYQLTTAGKQAEKEFANHD